MTDPPAPQARLSAWLSSLRNASLRGSPYTTVTVLPPRPCFSIRSLATIRVGIGSDAVRWLLHLQSRCGQPQPAHVPDVPVEYTSRAPLLGLTLFLRLTRPS